MVLLFPSTADRFKHYSTTNGVYGDFYGTAIREIRRDYDLHVDCNKRISEVTEQLQQAKSCLEGVDCTGAMLDQGQRTPRGAPQGQDCGQPLPSCNENICSFASTPKACGQKREPEFLEDHVRHYHPHLAPKPQVLPKKLFGQSNRPLSGGTYSRGVGSAGGFGVGLNSEVVASRSNSRGRKRPNSPPPVAKKSVLPATSRYNFYRYYGNAGQGAKTSKGYHPKF